MCTKLAQLRFHSPRNETCCATRKKRQAQVNAKSHPLQNEPQFLCFCGTSLSLVASHWLRIGTGESRGKSAVTRELNPITTRCSPTTPSRSFTRPAGAIRARSTTSRCKPSSPPSPPTRPSSTNPPPAQPSPKSRRTEHHPDTPNTTDPAGHLPAGSFHSRTCSPSTPPSCSS